jgi:hypothetical protein
MPNSGESEYTAGFPGMLPPGQTEGLAQPPVEGFESGLWDNCEPGNSCTVCGGGYCQPPLYYMDQGVRIINRSRPRPVTLGTHEILVPTQSGNVSFTVNDFNTRSVNYDVAPGYAVTIGRYLGRDSQDRDDFLEFSYWGMNTWTDSNYILGQLLTTSSDAFGRPLTFGSVNSPFPFAVGGFNRAESQSITVSSEMHNFELNLRLRPRGRPDQLVLQPNGRWRRECTPGAYMSFLAGLRYMTIGDGFTWNTRGRVFDPGVTGNPNIPAAVRDVYGYYNVQTENDLLGLQIGTDLIFRRCKWSWGVRAKAGPYIDFARSMQEIKNDPFGDPFSTVWIDSRFNTVKHKVAFLGEVGFEANYKFTPTFTGRVGYDFMWITGIALAPEQLQFVAQPEGIINTNGSIFSHGLSMGLEWTW